MIETMDGTRRGFLSQVFTAGALVVSAPLLSTDLLAKAAPHSDGASAQAWTPSVYLGIEPDGTVKIIAHRSEMGTGCRTCLPQIVADELEADWARVSIVQGLGDARYGSQDTDGSQSVRNFYDAMRVAGGTARTMLEQAAATKWSVPPSECQGKNHFVVHAPSGRKLAYGELVAAARALPVPERGTLRFKSAAEFRYIGKDMAQTDLHDMVTGKAVYGIDAQMPGMLYAAVERPPVLGATMLSADDAAARQVPGVLDVVKLPLAKPPYAFQALGGVAVLAENSWSALQGRKKLKVEWAAGPNGVYDSGKLKQELLSTVSKPCRAVRTMGDVDAQFASANQVHEASYYAPMLAHASMEPPAAVAEYKDGKVVTWAATQNPQGVQETVAQILGLKPADVTCHVTLLGGAFGRKSKPDFVVEAALLSKQSGKPVKIVWDRTDDLHFDYYHAPAGMYLKAALDDKGLPVAWLNRSAFPPIGMLWDDKEEYGGFQINMGWTEVPYRLANVRVENGPAKSHVRIGWLRSVSHVHHAFAVQCFTDELAARAKRDRVEYLLALLGEPRVIDFSKEGMPEAKGFDPKSALDTGRLRHVIEVAAEKSGWANYKAKPGRALGIAAHWSFFTYVATVVEVEVTPKGEVRIPRVDIVLDAGQVINPDRVRSQFEGAVVFGTSIALMSEVTAADGRVQQSNFDGYPVARMNEAPQVTRVHIIPSTAPPAGVGEPGVPPMAPAICNAIFAATGKRIRDLPVGQQLA
jgi:isoquinoline 1-oxidoreductase beta subunit